MYREQRHGLLQHFEDKGILVIDCGYGINCIRGQQARILLGSNIPYPESIIVDTDEVVKQRLARLGMQQCWIKRGIHNHHAEDVSYDVPPMGHRTCCRNVSCAGSNARSSRGTFPASS